jgi:hypothetical protein
MISAFTEVNRKKNSIQNPHADIPTLLLVKLDDSLVIKVMNCGLESRSFSLRRKRGFVCCLLNYVGDNSDYIALNYWILVNSDLEKKC